MGADDEESDDEEDEVELDVVVGSTVVSIVDGHDHVLISESNILEPKEGPKRGDGKPSSAVPTYTR